jgi:5-methylcytosine-specific restriction endonuclease McrA
MDCHAYDEEYAEYHFEEIQEEYQKSVHAKRLGNNFSCWDCHDPHTYKTYARESDDILKVVAYDNEICLSCHGNEDKFYVYSDDPAATRLIENHDWLPKQEAHFQKVRCIECHTQTHDTLLVAHNILPKEKAVRKCVECHTRDSKLMASLYRHKIPESRGKYGFLNPKLAKDYYVIGANRNVFLNYASLIIFGLVVLGVLVHIILRIIYKQ